MESTNSKAIAGFTLGVLSIVLPYIGVVLGIIAIVLSNRSLAELRDTGEKGQSLAVSGRVCGIVGLCIHALLLVLIIIGFAAFFSHFSHFSHVPLP